MKHKKIGVFLGLVFLTSALFTPFFTTNHTVKAVDWWTLCQPGDIIMMDGSNEAWGIKNYPGINSNDHAVLFIGIRPNYPGTDWCIHAGAPVKYTQLISFRTDGQHFNFSVWRVKNLTPDEKNFAINWAKNMVGHYYQNPAVATCRKDWDKVDPMVPLKNYAFYCSEFVWAAYYNSSYWSHYWDPSCRIIDIDYNGFSKYPNYNGIQNEPCVNMGLPNSWVNGPPYYESLWASQPSRLAYAKSNEIKMDSDIQKIYS